MTLLNQVKQVINLSDFFLLDNTEQQKIMSMYLEGHSLDEIENELNGLIEEVRNEHENYVMNETEKNESLSYLGN